MLGNQQGAEKPLPRFLLVVAASVIVRLAALFAVRNVAFASDAQDYTEMAKLLVSGKLTVPYWPPGVALYLAPFVAVGAGPTALRASVLVCWIIACFAFYRLMKALGVADKAWLVLLIFSCLPDAVQMSIEPMTQMPTTALLLVALSATVMAMRGVVMQEYLLVGTSLGLTALTRPSSIPLLILIPTVLAIVSRRLIPAVSAALLGFAIVGCWVGHVHTKTGHWLINTANASNLYYGNNPWTPVYRTWYFGSHAKPGSVEIEHFPEYKSVLEGIGRLPPLERPAAFRN
ncbi:MAG: hypothetical protein NVS9B15_09600 [Acidobacteriaceae bacterium]